MKRAQISRHKLTWFLMVPVLAAIIISAVMVRPTPEQTTNQTLPSFLAEEG